MLLRSHGQVKRQSFRSGNRQRYPLRSLLSEGLVGSIVSTHQDLEPSFSVHDDTELLFVLRTTYVWKEDLDRFPDSL